MLGKELGEGNGLWPTTGREKMELKENFERKFATVKRLGVAGNEGETSGWVVSIGVEVMSLGFTGCRKLLMSANASPDVASNNMQEANRLRTTDLLVSGGQNAQVPLFSLE